MSIRNVVKVMNFHSLIRVDSARRRAEKYRMMEDQLMYMMDSIANNRNLLLDKKIFEPAKEAPAVNIYIGSDLGFCGNYNSQMKDKLAADRGNSRKILIGRKLAARNAEGVDMRLRAEDLEEAMPKLRAYLEEKIRERQCSSINIIYNHYENTTTIYSRSLQIYPIVPGHTENPRAYREDFAMEGDVNDLLLGMMAAYVYYELRLALVNSRAAENVLRQNATTESLKKIDEIEAERLAARRRERRNKEFQKVVDNFIKKKMY